MIQRVIITMCLMVLYFNSYAVNEHPCQLVGYEDLIEVTVYPDDDIPAVPLTSENRKLATRLLKKCIKEYSVCILGAKPTIQRWMSKDLQITFENRFDPGIERLIWGLIQYVDKDLGLSFCIAAKNSAAMALPWIGNIWVISENGIKKYRAEDEQYTIAMTPKSLYRALLKSKNRVVSTYYSDRLKGE